MNTKSTLTAATVKQLRGAVRVRTGVKAGGGIAGSSKGGGFGGFIAGAL